MVLALGVGAFGTAIFHVMTHAFFKALLFLGAGSVIHGMSGEQDVQKMGGLREKMPVTFWTFLVGTLAIAGAPGLAGFFSKDEILHAAAANGQWVLYLVGLITAVMTSFYMFRAHYMTFSGSFRGTHEQEHHLHESPPVMTVPLWILAAGAAFAGFANAPKINWFNRFLEPVIAHLHGLGTDEHGLTPGLEIFLVLLAIAAAFGGLLVARALYGRDAGLEKERAWIARFPAAYRVLANKYYVDEIYDRLIVKPLAWLSWLFWKGIDTLLIDTVIVNGGAAATELTGDVGRFTTTGNVRNYALYFFLGVILLFWWIAFR